MPKNFLALFQSEVANVFHLLDLFCLEGYIVKDFESASLSGKECWNQLVMSATGVEEPRENFLHIQLLSPTLFSVY